MTDIDHNAEVLPASPAEPPKRKRGRPKGLGKVPGSGRQKATKNWTHPEIRDALLERSNAIEVLADIVAGRQLHVSGPTGKEYWARPTMQERLRATELLLKKILPDLQAQSIEMTGKDGAPLYGEQEQDPRQISRAILQVLGSAVTANLADDDDESMPRATFEFTAPRFELPLDEKAALDLSDSNTLPAIGERVLVGDQGAWIERTPDNRWRTMHADGTLGRYCRDRAEAEAQAGTFTW